LAWGASNLIWNYALVQWFLIEKDAVKNLNKENNDGEMRREDCDQPVEPAKQHQSGETPPDNEAHVDHIDPISNGGSGTPNNGRVLCRSCNLKKGAKPPVKANPTIPGH
jgi:5-methylcytosine-specific restriction endonuclease McrA